MKHTRHCKRFAGILLAFVMVFSLAVTAMAAGTGSITVDNPQSGQTYTAYKIFDVVYSGDNYSYTIAKDSEWMSVVAALDASGNATSNVPGLTFQKAADGITYSVIKGSGFSAASFADILKGNVTGKTGTVLTLSDGKATATGLDLGYYFVTSTSGALCNLTTTHPAATIHDKNDVPFEKTDDRESVDVGETVNYTITGKVPDTTGFTSYEYTISDTMSDGLTFDADDVTVKIAGVTLSKGTDYTYTKTTNGFTLTIDVMKQQENVGKEIKVTYAATVNQNAVAQIENNHATLTYSNNPSDSTSKTTTPPQEETVYSAKIIIDKYKAGDQTQKLADAKFVLMNNAGKYYKYIPATENNPASVSWVDSQSDATVVITDANGAGSFDGLKDGTYQLKEIAAPAGYNPLDSTVAITINGASATEIDLSSLTVTSEVANNTGSILPETGGVGTTIFYAAGSVLLVGAAILLITRKRMNSKK